MRNYFNRYHQGGQPNDRACEVSEIFEPAFLEPNVMSGEKDRQRASDVGVDVARRGHEARQNADDI